MARWIPLLSVPAFVLPLVFAGGINLRADIAPSTPTTTPSFEIYPDSETSYNPRVPCISPVDRPDGGKCMEAEAIFDYALAPYVQFAAGGTLKAQVRDNGRREAKDILTLSDGKVSLILRVAAAAKGGLPALVLLDGGKVVASAPFQAALPKSWSQVELQWDQTGARLSLASGETVKIALPALPHFKTVSLQTAQVTQLKIEGEGKFSLDWEDGYAARMEPRPDSQDVTARFFGFDTYVISQDRAKRDCPTVQVINGGAQEQSVTFDYRLAGEANQSHQEWSQQLKIPAQSAVMMPLAFPTPLSSDVYHLAIHSSSLQPVYAANRHFLFVEDRNEPKGTPKFGLHDSARNLFGCWPDALPVDLSTNYIYWGTVMGPPWDKDPGMTADTPPEQWNWSRRVDWAIAQGLTSYVSFQSTPYFDWARERSYPPEHMRTLGFGTLGGFPKLDLYRKFVKTVALRYKGKIHLYEIENEPMAHSGIPPEDYVEISRAVTEEVHAVDPDARVYGICGTGDFLPWMTKVFALGGPGVMDGVSIHTYVTPNMPETANLPAKLAEVDKLIANSGHPMHLLNSETGTYVALREEADHAISPARLEELVKAGTPNLFVKTGWPFHAIDERSGGISVIRNATYNFLAKAEYFTFFGYNPDWPSTDWWTQNGPYSCWAIISATKDGVRTPSLFTLAIGVLTEQLKGANQLQGRPVNQEGLMGGVFPKANGGEVAVVWSPMGKRSALIQAPGSEVELVTMLGQKKMLTTTGALGKGLFRLELDDEPVYLHFSQPGFQILPSPVIALSQQVSGSSAGFHFTVVNKYPQAWQGSVELAPPSGWKVTLDASDFSLDPGKRQVVNGTCEIPPGTKKGSYTVEASLKLPDGTPFAFPISIDVRPTLTVPAVADNFSWDQASSWQDVKPSFKIDQTDQVMIGRPPLLASLQEEKDWKGPGELSGEVRLASNAQDLFVYIDVLDVNLNAPKIWPGVIGSCVELFLDGRAPDAGLGSAPYSSGVHQLLLKAPEASAAPEPIQIADASEKFGKLDGVTAVAGRTSASKYWMAIQIPWKSLGATRTTGQPFGFDLGINGPGKGGVGRKSQMMLFGTGSDNSDASGFGMASQGTDAAK